MFGIHFVGRETFFNSVKSKMVKRIFNPLKYSKSSEVSLTVFLLYFFSRQIIGIL